jgi:hypothetical protein
MVISSDPHFKEPNAIRGQKPKDQPKDGINSPWDFRCPQYDQRSGCYVNAGTDYGTGINQPIGHTNGGKEYVDVMPFGRPPTMEVRE